MKSNRWIVAIVLATASAHPLPSKLSRRQPKLYRRRRDSIETTLVENSTGRK